MKSSDNNVINEVYTKSIFSLNPNYSSIYTVKKDNQYNQTIYQTKVNSTWLNPIQFENYHTEQTDTLKYGYPIKYERIQNDLDFDYQITYKSENNQELYSFIQVSNSIYTLHTINLTLEEHNDYLTQMGAQ